MSLTLPAKQTTSAQHNQKIHIKIRLWLCTWEIYPILLVAGILRLGGLNTTAFAGDQSVLYTLAYDAVHEGLIPATSNSASIFSMHPPLAIYFLMLPVFFSANPLWAAVMTALFTVVAVFLSYIFTRRYYGRLAATIAASLFATAQTSIVFSRFIWQPTLLSPFVILFLLALYRGVVERKKGWFLPALVLIGAMYQLHEIALVMVPLLVVALLLAPGTIRLRDIVLGFACLLILFTPYLVWEVHSNFSDIHTLLNLTNAHAQIDSKAITYYQRFLNAYYYDDRVLGSTYYDPVGSGDSLVFRLLPLLILARYMLTLLLFGAFAIAGTMILHAAHKAATHALSPEKKPSHIFLLSIRCMNWWTDLRKNPFRSGLILLVLWQIVPVLALSRHSATVHLHYLLITIPGQFMLIGFFLARTISWFQRQHTTRMWQTVRYGTLIVGALLLVTQLAGSTASLLDTMRGINNHIFGYNDLGSLQHAVKAADDVAQAHHLNRVYITISAKDDSLTALPYLAGQMHTPSTLFDATSCLVLPSLASGPAVLLMRSTDTLVAALLQHFAIATLVDKPPLLGTAPFLLYIVTPTLSPIPTRDGFANHLQLLQTQQFMVGTTPLLATRWTLLNNAQPGSFKTYTYIMRTKSTTSNASSIRSDCLFTAIRAHDQLIASFPLPQSSVRSGPPLFSITAQYLTTSPYTFAQGPFRFETYRSTSTLETLQSLDGRDSLDSLSMGGTSQTTS